MSKNTEAPEIQWVKYITPAYIVISLLIIVYFIYSFIVGGVYNVALSNGTQQGYQTAISQLIEQTSKQDCKPVAITLGETKVEVVNVACLQQAPTSQSASIETSMEK